MVEITGWRLSSDAGPHRVRGLWEAGKRRTLMKCAVPAGCRRRRLLGAARTGTVVSRTTVMLLGREMRLRKPAADTNIGTSLRAFTWIHNRCCSPETPTPIHRRGETREPRRRWRPSPGWSADGCDAGADRKVAFVIATRLPAAAMSRAKTDRPARRRCDSSIRSSRSPCRRAVPKRRQRQSNLGWRIPVDRGRDPAAVMVTRNRRGRSRR